VLRFSNSLAGVLVAAVVATTASAQQPGVSLSPFVTFPQSGDAGPLAGLTIGVTDGPFSLRASGQFSMRDRVGLPTANTSLVIRPWSADADALLYFARNDSGARLTLTPYVFAGVGTTTTDSGVFRIRRGGWSYGAGTGMPLFSTLGAFAEARWRMSEYVLPNAPGAPKPSLETRVGLSFRVGSGGAGLASLAEALIATAESYIGTPFRRGGSSPTGFDSWGFVRFVFGQLGVTLPSQQQQQSEIGSRVRPEWRALAPGDLVLFDDERGVEHVAIYAGRSRIIHAAESAGVRYDDVNSDRGRWYHDHLAGARRLNAPARKRQ
jgi:hypothetical protein